MNPSAVALRPPLRQPLFPVNAQRKCRECGHRMAEHGELPDRALAQQLSLIHGGCVECLACGDE